MKSTFLCWTVILISIKSISQSGIEWTKGLSFEQIKEKAKRENKYIFLDCFTTWCGPCKAMDKQVYSNDTVASFFNAKFISVKVQMDKIAKDDENVKNWYADVDKIQKLFHITAYPTFVFLSPKGDVINQDMGFKKVNDFMAMAQASLDPKMIYNNPFAKYEQLVAAYKNGEKNYDLFPYMIKMALKSRDTELSDQLLNELSDYVSKLKPTERYTKDRIEVWNELTFRTNSRVFLFFYNEGKIIDEVVGRKNYARDFVDKCIIADIVTPFLVDQAKNSKISVTGGYITDVSGKHLLKTDTSEADWPQLNRILRIKYNKEVAERNVLAAKIEWYKRHWNYISLAKYSLLKLKKFPPSDLTVWEQATNVNETAWNIFVNVTDKEMNEDAIKWMQKLLNEKSDAPGFMMDTYANLLYKAGRKKEAIVWEERAANIATGPFAIYQESFKKTLDKMKNGSLTWPQN